MNFIQMTLSAAFMILAVVVIRATLVKYLPQKTFLIFWGIILLRLLIPFSIPSPISIFTPIANYTQKLETDKGKEEADFLTIQQPNAVVENVVDNAKDQERISIWTFLWIAGIVLCAFYFLVLYVLCRIKFRISCLVENQMTVQWIREHKLKRKVEIRQSNHIQAPLTYGVIHPVILMPEWTDWSDITNIHYVLTHEFIHIRRCDAIFKYLLTIALCIHWFNPMVWVMYFAANKDIELSCDDLVIRSFGASSKSAYARALISMEEKKSNLTPFYNSFSKNTIEERIKSIMNYRKATKTAIIAAGMLVLSLTAIFVTSADSLAKVPQKMSQAVNNEVLPKKEFTVQSKKEKDVQTVVYDKVEKLRDDSNEYYIYWNKTNNTSRKIVSAECYMLAFDEDGNPLKLVWGPFDSKATYGFLFDWDDTKIAAGKTYSPKGGGWSLDKDSKVTKKIEYILFCDKKITFSDGTVWKNPDYKTWLKTYEGKKISVKTLENYYPYVQNITW